MVSSFHDSTIHSLYSNILRAFETEQPNVALMVRFLNYFANDNILDSSKLEEFAEDNSKYQENGRKFSKRVESTVGEGEIARYEQFLLFPQCF